MAGRGKSEEKKKKGGFWKDLFKRNASKDADKDASAQTPAQAPPSAGAENASTQTPSQEAPQMTPEEAHREMMMREDENRKAKAAHQEMMRKEAEDKARAANREMMMREEEARKAKEAHQEMMRKEAEDKARAANREMMEKEAADKARRKKIEDDALAAHQEMMEKESGARKEEIARKKPQFEKDYEETKKKADEVKDGGDEIIKSRISHRTIDREKVDRYKTNLSEVKSKYETLTDSYSILAYDKDYGYRKKLKELDEKKKHAEEAVEKADQKVEKYAGYRKRLEDETKDNRLMKLVRKIASLGTQGGATPPASGTLSPTPPPTMMGKVQEKAEVLEEFYSQNVDTWKESSENIIGIVHGSLDAAGKMKDGSAAATSDQVSGGIFSFFGTLTSVLKAWNTFSKMHARDKARRDRGEEKDTADKWQDARKGLEDIVDVIKNTLGTVGTFLGDGPAAILSIISNCAVLIMKFISIADSSARIHGINTRKSELWERLHEKREKYVKENDMESAEAYNLQGMWSRASRVKKKRDFLRQRLADGSFRLQAGVNAGNANTGNAIATGVDLTGGTVKYRKTKTSYGSDYASLSDKIDKEKSWGKAQNFGENSSEKKQYKTRVRLMEALELIERYYEEDQSQNRQLKLLGHSIEDSITESVDMIGNLADLSVVGAGIGKILNIASSCYGLVRGVGSWAYDKISEANGHANDKKLARNEMAETMFQAIKGITDESYGWRRDHFAVEAVENYKVASAANRMKHIRGMMTGLDLHLDPLLTADTKEKFLESLSSAFSQDGNG